MIDFIFATSYPSHFHAVNLQHNPSHYPAFARWLGSDYISKVQEWGAGIWYATMVDVDGQVRIRRHLRILSY
jgi:translocator assembly and maintenance protein 41